MSLISQLLLGFQAVAAQIKPLLRWTNTRLSLSTTATGGINTTADFDIGTLTIPANTLQVGDVIYFESYQNAGKGAVAMNYLNGFKVNGTKFTALNFALSSAASGGNNAAIRGMLAVRSIGVNGVLVYGAQSQFLTSFSAINNNAPTITINTTAALTVGVLANLSVANASNIIRSLGGVIKLW